MSGILEVVFDSLIFFGRFDCLIILLSTNLGTHRQTICQYDADLQCRPT